MAPNPRALFAAAARVGVPVTTARVLLVVCILAVAACAPQAAGAGATGAGTPGAGATAGSSAPADATTDATGRAGIEVPAVEHSTEMVATASFPDSAGRDVALLTAVDVGHHDGVDRVVWTFDGPPPAYRAAYAGRPILEDGSGTPVDIRGDGVLQIILTPAAGGELSGEQVRTVYQGPQRIDAAGTGTVQEVVLTGDFEATMTWAIGTDRQAPFRVTALTDPTRIVIDIAGR